MKTSGSVRISAALKQYAGLAGIAVAGAGGAVLVGWALNIPILRIWIPGTESMKPLTAAGLLVAGLSLWFHQEEGKSPGWRLPAIAGAAMVLLLGGITLLEYVFDFNMGIDLVLFRDMLLAEGRVNPGRPAPTTSLSFVLLGLAIFAIRGRLPRLTTFLTTPIFLIALLALVGYAYGVSSLYQIAVYTPMAVHSAVLLVIVTTGYLAFYADHPATETLTAGMAGSEMARRLLVAAVLVPFILGWLRLQGELLGLYHTRFGVALFASSNIVIFVMLIYWNARLLNRTDTERHAAYESIRRSEERYRNTLDHMLEGCQILGFDWRYVYINDVAAEQGRRSREELLGRTMMEVYPGIEDTPLFTTLKRCMQDRVPVQFENEFQYPDGVRSWFDLGIQPAPEGLFILSIDITQRKRAEAVLEEANAELEKRVAERTREFIESNARLQNEIAARGVAEETINRQNDMLSDLHQITLTLLRQPAMDDLLDTLVDSAARFLDAPYAEVVLQEEDMLVVKAATPNQQNLLGERVGREEARLAWQAFDTRQPVILKDYSQWPHRRFAYEKQGLRAVAEFPVLSEEHCLGVLSFGRDRPGYEFDRIHVEYGLLFADLVGMILENARLRDSLREQSIRDPLTGLFNRRYLDETLEREIQRAARLQIPLSVLMLDLDHFKRFNDTFGHPSGDALLREIGQVLRSQIRSDDIACRYGGEEFALILPGSDLETSTARARRLQEKMNTLQTRNSDLTPMRVTLSLGLAVFPKHGPTGAAVLEAADAALYRAKRGGRDRLVVAE